MIGQTKHTDWYGKPIHIGQVIVYMGSTFTNGIYLITRETPKSVKGRMHYCGTFMDHEQTLSPCNCCTLPALEAIQTLADRENT